MSARDIAGLARLVPLAWLGLFVVVPFAIVVRISLSEPATAQPPYRPHGPDRLLDLEGWRVFLDGLGLDNFRTLAAEPLYRDAALNSVGLAGLATAVLVVLGYPMALAVARAPGRWRPLLLALVILPFWTSFLVRVYAWIAILKEDGWLNQLLVLTGLAAAPPPVLGTNAAVLVGLVYAYLPFMVLPLYAVLEREDRALREAAADLGARPAAAFWTVTLPLSRPGLAAGALLCFVPMVGEFVVPDLLGGSDTLTLGRQLWSEFFSNRDWPLAAAVAVAILAIVLPLLLGRSRASRRAEARA